MDRRRRGPRPSALCAVALLGLVGCGAASTHAEPATVATAPVSQPIASSAGVRGIELTPAPRKAAITLTDTAGRPFSLVGATAGKLTYLYFGYTHCPDTCPTTMADLARALEQQPAAVRAKVSVVFVTTDPRRDTGPVLRAWLNLFDRSFVGLTGSQPQIDAAERAAGVPLAAAEPVPGGGYSIQHSAEVFAYSPDGIAHVVYAEGFTIADYAHDIPLLLAMRHATG